MQYIRLLWLVLATMASCPSYAQHEHRITISPESHNVMYLAQTEREYFIDYVVKLSDEQWLASDSELGLGLNSRSYWLKFNIPAKNTISHSNTWYLEIANPLIDQIDVYIQTEDSLHHHRGGDTILTAKRPIPSRMFLFPLPQNQQASTVYIKYKGGGAASAMPLALISRHDAFRNSTIVSLSFGVLLGLALTTLLISGGIYVARRETKHLYFVGYLLTLMLVVMSLEGFANLIIWPTLPWLQNILLPSLVLLSIWFAINFTAHALSFSQVLSKRVFQGFSLISKSLIVLCAILTALPFFVSGSISIVLVNLITLITTVLVISITKNTKPVDPLFAIAWCVALICITTKSLLLSGILRMSDPVLSIQFLYMLHILLFFTALAKQWYFEQKHLISQQQAIIITGQESLQTRQQTLDIQQQEHDSLEALVDERTFELNVTLRELQETNRRLEEQATNDALTGAKNRKFFDQRTIAEHRLSRRQQSPLSLLMLDIDNFKSVNDRYGHLIGDKVLVAFAQRSIQLLRRPNDYVCRYGGEEFAILLSNTDHKGALKVAELIRSKIEENTVVYDGQQVNVTVSIGVATLTVDDSTNKDQLFTLADKALYQAKNNGRNQVVGQRDINLLNE